MGMEFTIAVSQLWWKNELQLNRVKMNSVNLMNTTSYQHRGWAGALSSEQVHSCHALACLQVTGHMSCLCAGRSRVTWGPGGHLLPTGLERLLIHVHHWYSSTDTCWLHALHACWHSPADSTKLLFSARHCSTHHTSSGVGITTVLLEMRAEVKWLAHVHSGCKWWCSIWWCQAHRAAKLGSFLLLHVASRGYTVVWHIDGQNSKLYFKVPLDSWVKIFFLYNS